jgi:hypothetical protein
LLAVKKTVIAVFFVPTDRLVLGMISDRERANISKDE